MEGKDGKPLNARAAQFHPPRPLGRARAFPLTPPSCARCTRSESAVFLSMVKRDKDVRGNTHGSSKYEKDLKAFVEGLAQTQAKQLGVTLEPPPAEAVVAAAAASKGKVGGTRAARPTTRPRETARPHHRRQRRGGRRR